MTLADMHGRAFLNRNDLEILEKIRELAQTERRITTEVLWNLREIERRRIFAQLGYSTLFDFCLKELQYSEGAASRRIRAMRLLKDVNELEDALRNGAISLTTASQVQSFLQKEKKQNRVYSQDEKRALVHAVQGKSKTETEQFLGIISPSSMISDKTRFVTEDRVELRFEVDRATFENLQRIRALLSHELVDGSFRELLAKMAEIALKGIAPLRETVDEAVTDSIPAGLRRENSIAKYLRDRPLPG